MSPAGRLNIYISKDVHTAVKVHAAKTDQSVSAVVECAIREYLERHADKDVTVLLVQKKCDGL